MVRLLRKLALLVLSLLAVTGGCGRQSADPMAAARLFIAAALGGEKAVLLDTVTEESRRLLESPAPTTEMGIFHFLKWDAPPKEGVQYVLVQSRLQGEHAQVNLRPGQTPSGPFADPRLPTEIRETGVPILLTKEGGVWKVDLFGTSDALAKIIMQQSQPGSAPPPGWPGMPGMPGPPGPPPPR